ncbi:MAG: DUF3298 domain-containing protein [Ruminococcaceae bacterium]|nr:DUF3298 domain-containing protein [Oscillospiraceae bacterium]
MSTNQTKRPSLPLPLLILSFLLVFLIALLLSTQLSHNVSSDAQSTREDQTTWPPITFPEISSLPPFETIPEDCEPLSFLPEAVTDSYELDGTTLAFASINCPVFRGGISASTDKINTVLREYCLSIGTIEESEQFVIKEDYLFSQSAGSRFETHERNGDYTVFVKEQTLSVLFRIHSKSGGANTITILRAFAFDLFSGDTVTFADYIASEEALAKDYIVSVFSQWIDRNAENFYTDAKELLAMGDHLQDFYLTETGLVLFLNPDVISPMVLGPQWIEIPYHKLGR